MLEKLNDYFKRSLYFFASIMLFLSFAIFIGLYISFGRSIQLEITLIPIILGTTIAFILLLLYLNWRKKQYALVRTHMKKNYLNYDILAVILVFILLIVQYIISISFVNSRVLENKSLELILVLTAYGVALLIPQAFHQYFLYKIKIDLVQRREGFSKEFKLSDKFRKNPKKIETKNKPVDKEKPTAGKFYDN